MAKNFVYVYHDMEHNECEVFDTITKAQQHGVDEADHEWVPASDDEWQDLNCDYICIYRRGVK